MRNASVTPGATAGPPPPRRSRCRVWLLISLAVNALLIGLIAGAVALGPRRGPPGPDAFLPRITGHLSEEGRATLHQAFADHRGELTGSFRRIVQARRALGDVIIAEPIDAAAVRAAFDRQRDALNEGVAVLHAPLEQAIPQLSREDREAMREMMGRVFRRGHDGGGLMLGPPSRGSPPE